MDKRNSKKKTVGDTVCEIHKFSGYAVLNNCFVRSTKLGCPAIGLLGRVMDLPLSWVFTKAGLIALCPDGETAIDSALNYLKEWGYLEIEVKMPNENPTGKIQTIYKFYEYSAKDTSIPQYDYELETFTVDNAVLNRVKKVGNFTMISSKLLSNESVNNHLEYVYSFFDVPVSKEEADELEAETRRKAITIREGGKTKAAVSSTDEKQRVEKPYLDNPSSETPLSENQGQYNTYNSIQKNLLLSDKSSIIPAAAKPTFNIPSVGKLNDGYNAEEVDYYTEVVKQNIDYWELGEWLTEDDHDGYKEADNIVDFIVNEICSPLPYTTLRGQAFPRAVIQSKMLQANIYMVENVLENMAKVDNIKDTMLFLGGKEKSTLKEISESFGKETIDSFNTSTNRGQSESNGMNYQKLGKELKSQDELAVMDGGKCILQLRGVRPFFSDKYDITRHKNYSELLDADEG